MNLGELIAHLERANPEHGVAIAWPEHCQGYGQWAGELTSYRGYYDQLALTPSDKRRTVAQVLKDARKADGATFTGWKGGDFTMSRGTSVWAADHGDATSLGLAAPFQGFDCLTFPTIDVSDYQGW